MARSAFSLQLHLSEAIVPQPRLLLLSNSTSPGGAYLAWAESHLGVFLGRDVRRIFFVPYASVVRPYSEYAAAVRKPLGSLGYEVVAAHETTNPVAELERADAVAVGGGNTFHLLKHLYHTGLLPAIRHAVQRGMPYVGWSAGSNVACPSIRTTNDMPIVDVPSLAALGLIRFQLNAHYTEERIANHGGETRVERLNEFVAANPGMPVVALPEGTALRVEGQELTLIGRKKAVVFGLNGKPVKLGAQELAGLGLLRAES
jgi:dipeptidase E